ncbi:MAG: hypothetical protein K2O18_20015 [Oscillospiraceae bacterium]|nr:hypothetical protein [Oscillospiraceae bacterium]
MNRFESKILPAAIMAVSACQTVTANAAAIKIPTVQMPSIGTPPDASELSGFFGGFKAIGTAVSGICAITALIFFVISVTKLSTSAGNDMQRSRAIRGILYSGLSLALFGGITVVSGIFWNILS